MQPAPLTSGRLALEEITCRGWGPHLQYSFLINFFCLRMWRKNGAKEPQNSTPLGNSAHAKPPTQKCGNLDISNPNLTQPCGGGRGPGVVALATHEQLAPIVPIARLLHVELAYNLQSPGVPFHTQVREPQSAMRPQEQLLVQCVEVPSVQWRP